MLLLNFETKKVLGSNLCYYLFIVFFVQFSTKYIVVALVLAMFGLRWTL